MSNKFLELLSKRDWLLADGATGTNLFDVGLETGDSPELWNIEQPEKIYNLQKAFVDSGSDIILTNTFGGTRNRMKLHKMEDRVAELNAAAVEITRRVADSAGRPVIVAGSMGPTGDIFEPVGSLTRQEGIDAFREQAVALAGAGADVLWLETISAPEELEAAVTACSETGLPIVTTLSFDTNGRTMMGLTPSNFARKVKELSPVPVAYGANCGVGASEMVAALINMAMAAEEGDILVSKSNCGIPEYVDGAIRYNGTPELMADYARIAVDAGIRIIGGCCGTSPDHVRHMRNALDSHTRGKKPGLDEVVARLGEISNGAREQNSLGPLGSKPEAPAREGRRRGRDPKRKAADDGKFPGQL
ncbi:betaine--homocysteine S-methyltransferase [Kiloniella laminariae]|uniref:Betaine--homocysteine S-methyltransferase n=1 Tax=Kiloniella laminariae TaxID=454162 RepID=A0ABT4LSA8_9PROT|nr:betaine--homocysteine S-methyltransferase [Kiloniella laminariae]MCZ4282822.1 betaine--homocysteine S-methyltransferase [Kiloniella laminariae]